MYRPITPQILSRKPRQHYTTLTKAVVLAAVDFCEKSKTLYYKEDIFRTFNVNQRQGYEWLWTGVTRRMYNDPKQDKTRGHKPIILVEKIREMKVVLETESIEARRFTWEQLGNEVGLDCSGRTIQRAMGTMNYHKCIAYRKGWVNERLAERRMEYATTMLQRYPEPRDWQRVRFSDKVHFGWGPEGALRIIQKSGQRYYYDCIQERPEPEEKDKRKIHCWAAVGHNFKSDIIFYDSGNPNGKMKQEVYINQILEPVVKPWLRAGQDFVLEEDNDSGHGPGKSYIVRTWKEKNGLEHYFNCAHSPDLAPIENCWQVPKAYTRKYPHWDDETLKELIMEGWAQVSQRFINEKVAEMPKQLQDVFDGEGKMTGH